MEYGLEVVVLPVSDVDKAKDFYQGLGWRLDADFHGSPDYPGGAADLIMADMCDHFHQFMVEGTTLNRAKLTDNIDRSVMMVTALSPSSGMTRPQPSPTPRH